MLRKLSAIEIAEGALLADIAVVFQLLVHYLPFIGIYFTLLVPTVFTILVLRRGFYASVISLCVAAFIIGILTNFGRMPLMFLEVGAGIGANTPFLWNPQVKRWVCLEPDALLARRIRERFAVEEISITPMSPSFGAHIGPGGVAVAILGRSESVGAQLHQV